MATIRFLSPDSPHLKVDGVPAQFRDGVCDIDDTDPRLAKMRYLGAPYGVIEMGAVGNTLPWPTPEQIAADAADPTTVIGAALAAAFATATAVQANTDAITALRQRVDGIGGGSGNRVAIGTDPAAALDPSALPDGVRLALLSADPAA